MTAGLLLALVLFLSRTVFGLQMRAAAEDFFVARILGIKADRVHRRGFRHQWCTCRGRGDSLLRADRSRPSGNRPYTGTGGIHCSEHRRLGSLPGSILGAYLLGATSVALQATLPLGLRSFRDALVFLVVVIILVVKPDSRRKRHPRRAHPDG